MARRTVTVTHIQYWKKHIRNENKAQDIGRLPDGGDFLYWLVDLWRKLEADELSEHERAEYRRLVRAIPSGRTLTITGLVGRYGDPASLRDPSTGDERFFHEGDLSSTVGVRVVFAVPTRGTSALMFIERANEGFLGGAFLGGIKRAWAEDFGEWTLNVESLTRGSVWLDAAELEQVTAVSYGYSADIADAGIANALGIVRTTIVPEKGIAHFPKRLFNLLRDNDIDRSALLGIRYEPDEIRVQMSHAGQQKTFVIDKEKSPSIRYLVTDANQQSLTDDAFLAWCVAEARGLFGDLGVDWNTSSETWVWDSDVMSGEEVKDG